MDYKCFFLLFIAGLLPGMIQLAHPESLGWGEGAEMLTEARNLEQRGIYGDSFRSLKTGPTATNPPIYPLFLAFCIRLFRTPILIIGAVLLANIVVNALAPALLPQVSTALWGTPVPGIAGAILSIAAAQLMPAWDADYTQLGLILFCLLTTQLMQNHSYSVWSGAVAGSALGILFLLSQVVLLVALPWIAFQVVKQRPPIRHLFRFLSAFLFAALLVNVPWLARNYAIWGELVTRTNFGMTLHASNNDCAQPSIYEELRSGCYAATHPESSVEEAALLKSLGEPAYDRRKTAETMKWIQSQPQRFLQLTFARMVQFWFPVPKPPVYATYVVWGISLLSAPGFLLMIYRRIPAALLLGAVLLLYSLPYYVVVSAIRYRIPVLWVSSLAAGYFLAAVRARRQPGVR